MSDRASDSGELSDHEISELSDRVVPNRLVGKFCNSVFTMDPRGSRFVQSGN